jgi:hypothetical protein
MKKNRRKSTEMCDLILEKWNNGESEKEKEITQTIGICLYVLIY